MYSSTLSLTSSLDGVGGQRHAPPDLPPGTTPYPLYGRLGGPQSRSGQVRKISPPPGFDPRTVQPVASRLRNKVGFKSFEHLKWLAFGDEVENEHEIQKMVRESWFCS
jgi:hypothetical protein